jgi:hypothetical protein
MGHLVWWRLVGFKTMIERQVGKPKWALDCTGEYASLYTQGIYVSSFFGMDWVCVGS